MALLVLQLLALLRDLLLDCHRNGREATLKFCTGFVLDWHLQYYMHERWRCLGLEDSVGILTHINNL